MKKTLLVMCAMALLSTGSLFAQESAGANANANANTNSINVNVNSNSSGNGTYAEGLMTGEMMAKGSGGYFFSGFCLGAIGIIIPAVRDPEVPSQFVMGKSMEYIQGFREGYKSKAKSINTRHAINGCLVSSATYGLIYAIVMASAASSAAAYY